jgi:hypothetical protein
VSGGASIVVSGTVLSRGADPGRGTARRKASSTIIASSIRRAIDGQRRARFALESQENLPRRPGQCAGAADMSSFPSLQLATVNRVRGSPVGRFRIHTRGEPPGSSHGVPRRVPNAPGNVVQVSIPTM